ncbi:MAG TPA: cyclic nucleotide-binding domain-containing protein [Geminicoccaceae bacterium]|nr:cyclic nucleotide-binding domain-containing protein [Geminicoccaceae bacterium]
MAIMNPREVLEQVRGFPLRSFAAGERVICQGTATGLLLFLNEGAVDVALEDTFIARVAEPGAVFGDLAFLLDQPHTATVTAVQPCSFHVVEEPEAFLEAEPKVAVYVARVLARRMNAVNHLLVEARRRASDSDQLRGVLAETLDRIARALQTYGPR